jgi:hypothetical protein
VHAHFHEVVRKDRIYLRLLSSVHKLKANAPYRSIRYMVYSLFLKYEYMQLYQFITRTTCIQLSPFNTCQTSSLALLRALLRWSLYVSHFQPYDLSNIELLTCV